MPFSFMDEDIKGLKVLFVDDSPSALKGLSSHAEQFGFVTFTLSEPKDIILALEDFKPDILVTDYQMPECDGFELIRRVRANSNYDEIPVILLTGNDDPELCQKAIEVGADDFIAKNDFMRLLLPKMLALGRIRKKNKALTKLKQMEALHLLVATVKHEFGNALMLILGFSMRISNNITKADETVVVSKKIYDQCVKLGEILKKLDKIEEIKTEDYTTDTKMFKL